MKRTGILLINLILYSCLVLLLAGCGQRGPLYLPEKNDAPVSQQTEAAGDENTREDTEEDTEAKDDSKSGR